MKKCYRCLIHPDDVVHSHFAEVGVGMGETPNLLDKSHIPVKYRGCYEVTWNCLGYYDRISFDSIYI